MPRQRLPKFHFAIQDVNSIKRSPGPMHYIHEDRNASHGLDSEQSTLGV